MQNTTLARLVCDEATAKRLAEAVSEHFDSAAIAAFEGTGGNWTLEVHFEDAPDEAALRSVVAEVAGAESAARVDLRGDRREGLGGGKPRRPEAGPGRALHGARRA